MALLTSDHQDHFRENGYVLIENVVPPDLCEAVVEDINRFLGNDADDPETWYEPPPGLDDHFGSGGAIEMYHAQSLWNTRQHETLYQAFAEILGAEQLWVSLDRANFTPPAHEDHPDIDRRLPVHWDLDESTIPEQSVQPRGTELVPYGVQGVLHLCDTNDHQGGFYGYPEAFQNLEGFMDRQDTDFSTDGIDSLDVDGYEQTTITGDQGDLLIWNSLLPHGNTRNRSDVPRYAQYITMSPENFADRDAREGRVKTWRDQEPIATPGPGDPREFEKTSSPADLTPLGRRLLGIDPWHGWLNT